MKFTFTLPTSKVRPIITMSHHSDDAMLVAVTDSFWEPGNFKKTTKRTEDGLRLCSDLVQLITERSEIEKSYAKNLKQWAKKWNDLIEKGPEYGTTEAAWKAVLIESERRCEMHLKVREKLINDVIGNIKQWQKDNYHKSMMQLKEKKEFDDAFKKVSSNKNVYSFFYIHSFTFILLYSFFFIYSFSLTLILLII